LPYGQFPDAKTSAGIDLEFRTLSIADYVLSDRVGVERKTTDDFLKTLLERHELFSQLMDLKMAYNLTFRVSLVTKFEIVEKSIQ
jgi:ERCC4-type nuclease